MANLVADLGQHLVDKSVATSAGTDLFHGFKPDIPDDLIVVSEYGAGSNADIYSNTATRNIQVLTRATEPEAARLKSNAALHALIEEEVQENFPNGRVGVVSIESVPMKLGKDVKGRTEYVFDISITTTMD